MAVHQRCAQILALAVVLTMALNACGADAPSPDGPLGDSDAPWGSECLPAQPHAPSTYSEIRVNSDARHSALVTRVALRNPKHLTLVGSLSVPLIGFRNYVGEGRPWPLSTRLPGANWRDQRPITGTVMTPGGTLAGDEPPHNAYIFAFAVKADPNEVGSADGVDVYYTIDGASYVLRGTWSITIAPVACDDLDKQSPRTAGKKPSR
jgi:hypothetical protein